MNEVLPSATPFEAVVSIVSASVYLAVAAAALVRAPRDIRTRLFLVIALVNLPAYYAPVSFWRQGSGVSWTRPLVLALWVSTALGSVALFHFAQSFPWRRPWIRKFGRWVWLFYVLAPLPIAVLILLAPSSPAEIDLYYLAGATAVILPAIVVVGGLLPIAGLLSLYKSYTAARRDGIEPARVTLLWMLISQLAGGVLAIIVIPMLHVVAPAGPYASVGGGVLLITGLLMPAAFAIGVWRYHILSLDPAAFPEDPGRPRP